MLTDEQPPMIWTFVHGSVRFLRGDRGYDVTSATIVAGDGDCGHRRTGHRAGALRRGVAPAADERQGAATEQRECEVSRRIGSR
jgi:hypothetical protein